MRKTISVLVVFLFAALLLLGCSKEENAVSEPQQQAAEPEPVVKEIPKEAAVIEEEETAETKNAGITVIIDDEGFKPAELSVNVGDEVTWENKREGRVSKVLIVGSRDCPLVKSRSFESGESFTWKFEKAVSCIIRDSVLGTQTMEIIVE